MNIVLIKKSPNMRIITLDYFFAVSLLVTGIKRVHLSPKAQYVQNAFLKGLR